MLETNLNEFENIHTKIQDFDAEMRELLRKVSDLRGYRIPIDVGEF